MFKNLLLFVAFSVCAHLVQAQDAQFNGDMNLLRNDKEPVIKVFSKRVKKKIQKLYQDPNQNEQLRQIFYDSVRNTLNQSQICELNLVRDFKENLEKNNLPSNQKKLEEYLKVLRVNHSIDDILYLITLSAINDHEKLAELDLTKSASSSRPKKNLLDANDLSDLFSNFAIWPNDQEYCTYQEFFYLKTNVILPSGKKSLSDKDVKALIGEAYHQKIIGLETYHKLLYLLNESKLDKRDLWLNDYLKVIFKSKNKMIPLNNSYDVNNIEDEDDFSQEKIKRFSKITRRRLLYRKYNDIQIIFLAQVLQKASRRMGVDPDTTTSIPVITQEFWVLNKAGEKENYVETIELDSQSQYNLARRRMRKDILDLQMMEIFTKSTITYEDVVMAALETGYITLDDLSYVVKYDDLWNPNLSSYEKVSRFIFTISGYSTFFLPPPWNITASIALGIVEGIVESRKPNYGASNDNPGTFIE